MNTKIQIGILLLVSSLSIFYLISLETPNLFESLNVLFCVTITMFSVLYWEVLWDAIKGYITTKISRRNF